MASIVKRGDHFYVVYLYTDGTGKRKQKWEPYKTQPEAKTRQKEIEYKEQIGTFVIPQCNTLDDLLKEYVSLYGKNTWALSTYSSNVGLIKNYISPLIGNMKLKDITPRVLEKHPKSNGFRGSQAYLTGLEPSKYRDFSRLSETQQNSSATTRRSLLSGRSEVRIPSGVPR